MTLKNNSAYTESTYLLKCLGLQKKYPSSRDAVSLPCVVCDSQSLRTASPAAAKPPPPLLSAHKSSHRLSLAFAQQILDIAETPVSPTGSVLDPELYLWTGAALYARYRLLLISNKFWTGRGGRWGPYLSVHSRSGSCSEYNQRTRFNFKKLIKKQTPEMFFESN
jgi:hypothetical protein